MYLKGKEEECPGTVGRSKDQRPSGRRFPERPKSWCNADQCCGQTRKLGTFHHASLPGSLQCLICEELLVFDYDIGRTPEIRDFIFEKTPSKWEDPPNYLEDVLHTRVCKRPVYY